MSRPAEFKAGSVGLSEHDRKVIDFERASANDKKDGSKEHGIRETLGMTATGYYQHLNRLTESHEAHKYDAQTMKRVQRKANHPPRTAQPWGM
jgi:hypothetical protein